MPILTPAAGRLGAYVSDIDLSLPLPPETVTLLWRALAEHQVLFFRDQPLTPARHVALGRQFGALMVHPMYRAVPGFPELTVLEATPDRPYPIDTWHSDMTYEARPPLAVLLQAKLLPERGGDTMWSSLAAAWEALSAPMQRMLDGLEAVHSFAHGYRHSLAERGRELADVLDSKPPQRHAIAQRHPETGRTMLCVNPLYTTRIVGLPEAESDAMLRFLCEHLGRPDFTVRLQWKVDTLAFWDNRSTLHLPVNDFFPQRRLLHRVTIANPEG